MRLLRILPWLALPTVMLAASCRDPTEITITVTTDLPCPPATGSPMKPLAMAWIASSGTEVPASNCTPRSPYNYVGSIVMVPGAAGDDAKVEVTVRGSLNPTTSEDCRNSENNVGDCLVVRRRLSFIPHTPLTLPVRLDSRCLNVSCPDSETCIDGLCKPIDFDPTLPPVDAGVDATVDADPPPPGPPLKAEALFAGGDSTCARLADESVVCWGDNTGGHLFGGLAPSIPPTTATLLHGARSIALGAAHGCALIGGAGSTTRAQCWGDNTTSQLGLGSSKVARSDVPVAVTDAVDGTGNPFAIKSWRSLTAGDHFTCASVLGANALDVACWGEDTFGQASGTGADTGGVTAPTIVGINGGAEGALTAGPDYACALVTPAQTCTTCVFAACWGANADGQCGVPPSSPVQVQNGTISPRFAGTAIWAGSAHVVATDGQSALGWGRNKEKQLSTTGKGVALAPASLDLASSHFALGASSTCYITGATSVSCRGTGAVVSAPQNIANAVDLVGGKSHACALLLDHTVQCWGNNDHGQLGGGAAADVGPRVIAAP